MGTRLEGLIVTNNEEAQVYAKKLMWIVNDYLGYVRDFVSKTEELENLGKNLSNLKTTMKTLEAETNKIEEVTGVTLSNFIILTDAYAKEQAKTINFE